MINQQVLRASTRPFVHLFLHICHMINKRRDTVRMHRCPVGLVSFLLKVDICALEPVIAGRNCTVYRKLVCFIDERSPRITLPMTLDRIDHTFHDGKSSLASKFPFLSSGPRRTCQWHLLSHSAEHPYSTSAIRHASLESIEFLAPPKVWLFE